MLRKKNSNVSRVLIGGLAAIGTMFLLTAAIGMQSCKEKKWEVKQENEDQPKTEALKIAEKMPEFNGDFMAYMIEHTKYPKEAMEKKIEGRVTVKFIVTENGDVTKAEIVKSPDPSLSDAALKVVNDMPNWIPGENGGKKVPVYMYLPVSFKLSS
jgi:protein TonB